MLITTSRKPSPRTRTFAKSLERVLNSRYVNRGKMSLRDAFIKSRDLSFNKTAVISEIKGNPSRIDFYGSEGDLILKLDITVSNPLNSQRINKKNLLLRWDLTGLAVLKDKLISILEIVDIESVSKTMTKSALKGQLDSNLVLVKKGEKGSKAVIEFYSQQGQITGPKIYIHQFSFGEDIVT
jgi:U3 small nucleolar ribonucleoprotein protein IMP4